MGSSIRRSPPAIGEASHGSRAACTATRCEKSAFSSIDSLSEDLLRLRSERSGVARRSEAHRLRTPSVFRPTERFAKFQPHPRLVQKELLNKDGRHARASDTSG